MATKKAASIEEASEEVQKDQKTLSREAEDKLVSKLDDTPENINHLRRMGRHQDADKMDARRIVALASE